MELTAYLFLNEIKRFLNTLKVDPINADTSDILKDYGFDREKVLYMLKKYGLIKRYSKSNTKDENGMYKKPTMNVRFAFSKDLNNNKLFDIYKKEVMNTRRNLREDGAVSCADATGGADNQILQPLTSIVMKRNILPKKNKKNKKETMKKSIRLSEDKLMKLIKEAIENTDNDNYVFICYTNPYQGKRSGFKFWDENRKHCYNVLDDNCSYEQACDSLKRKYQSLTEDYDTEIEDFFEDDGYYYEVMPKKDFIEIIDNPQNYAFYQEQRRKEEEEVDEAKMSRKRKISEEYKRNDVKADFFDYIDSIDSIDELRSLCSNFVRWLDVKTLEEFADFYELEDTFNKMFGEEDVNESRKRSINEADDYVWHDNEGKYHPKYRNIPGAFFLSHGEWSDPEIVYKGQFMNYYVFEDGLWETFKDYMSQEDMVEELEKTTGKEAKIDEDTFEDWLNHMGTDWLEQELSDAIYMYNGGEL